MKRYYYLCLMLLLAAVACDRESCTLCSEALPRHLQLELSGLSLQTKGSPVHCLLYVFSRNGQLVDCHSSDGGSFDFYLTDETYDFVAVANKKDLPTREISKTELFSSVTRLEENSPDRLVMVGQLDGHTVDADEKITVEVRRVAAKVSYTLHTAFEGMLAGQAFTVEKIYMTNVVGENRLSLADSLPVASSPWFNRMDWEPENSGPTELMSGPVFYIYPNASPDNHDKSQWESRCTRFVVQASLAGRTTYYPITLEKVRSNHHYHIDLTLANWGVDHPEDTVQTYGAASTVMTVLAWEPGGAFEGTY